MVLCTDMIAESAILAMELAASGVSVVPLINPAAILDEAHGNDSYALLGRVE